MLKNVNSSAIVAVKDIDRARAFYATILDLPIDDTLDDVLTFRTGATSLMVYRSEEAGTNRANAVVWAVGEEIEAIVAELAAKGVVFEHYDDFDGMRVEGDLHVVGEMKLAWFKDPDGNVLHLNNM